MQLSMQQQAHSTLHPQHLHEMERALHVPVLSLRNTKLLLPTHAMDGSLVVSHHILLFTALIPTSDIHLAMFTDAVGIM